MASVTQRIKQITQPRGGYVPPARMTPTPLSDDHPEPLKTSDEKFSPTLMGLAVDYMSRLGRGNPPTSAFGTSLMGAYLLGPEEFDRAADLIGRIKGLDHDSLVAACRLTGYDVVSRNGGVGFKPVEQINPSTVATDHIATMVRRIAAFVASVGPVVADGFHFDPDGYTETVSQGDGDLLTADTLWDIKVSKNPPTKENTLQLLMYYLMGHHSGQDIFSTVTCMGICNPRLNTIYRLPAADIDPQTIAAVSHDVIGYR